MSKVKPHLFEDGDRIYLVAPVTPFEPGESDIEHFAFADNLKKQAPNENLLWLKGNYVEADKANANGHQWTEGELAIKSLTPMYCPVTVMHDPRTAVGLIADTRLLVPEKDGVPRARIETALAIWQHRFPEVAAEVLHNYKAGELMQSMECTSPYYDCAECGQTFHKLPDGAEEAMWCEHLAESPNAGRILRGVTFTGTGLIFGSRGARGAYSEANLETAVKEEIVAAHQELHTDRNHTTSSGPRRVIPMDKMEIDRDEYTKLIARPTTEEHASVVAEKDEAADKLSKAEKDLETAETAQKKAEEERDEIKAEKEKAEETVRATELAGERLGKLGKDFKAKLTEKITERLGEQAKELSDDDWEARLSELEDLTEVQRDAGGAGSEEAEAASGTVTTEETAQARVSGGSRNGGGSAPSTAQRSTVIGGLVKGGAKAAKTE